MAHKVSPQNIRPRPGQEVPSEPVDPKAQDYIGMWAMFMVIFGINTVAHVNPAIGAAISAVVAGGLGQVIPVGKDNKRIPMPAAAGMIIVGAILILIGFLTGGKKK